MRFVYPALLGLISLAFAAAGFAQPFTAAQRQPNLRGQLDRPLRYTPDNGDFVIRNGEEFFNRPLYGGNTAFRVDAGDKPEFALYLPGRGGNLRFGIRTSDGTAKWFNEAAEITARYRPGSMLYEIHDPLLGAHGRVDISVIALAATEGIIVKIDAHAVAEKIELVWTYGGANGKRGKRDGDIGTESVPISEYFQVTPATCAGQTFALNGSNFTLQTSSALLSGTMPSDAQLTIGDAHAWNRCVELLASSASKQSPVLVGRMPLKRDTTHYFTVQRVDKNAATELAEYLAVTDRAGKKDDKAVTTNLAPPYRVEDLPRVFTEAEKHFTNLRRQIRVETPDAFLDAAVGAMNVAADAIWDEPQGAVMHGAIAWRSKLLGWRGPYAMDALGWHERARRHLSYWATRQNTAAIPDQIAPPDENSNLARSEVALHTNGDLSNSHYDMNLVYIDAVFRHLRWTGDLEFARTMWPVIERHLAWERRLFRREFTKNDETLPLYEAYAAIWASDDLQYHGGGVTHASAYNYYHNTMAARVAKLVGVDATPYEREADLIHRGMRAHLWLDESGTFAEYKDLLGRQLVHPSAGLWTIYHTIDSEAADLGEAQRMVDYVKQNLPALPVRGPGVPTDADYHVYASTNWMPYEWSINNVVMGENLHTALAFWQAGRAQDAWELTKGSLLAAMFMGICPGNVGSMSYLDVYRRESQRDFGDGSGVMSRTIVEGLFGVRPDALAGVVALAPGFPTSWDHAAITHPDFEFQFLRATNLDIYTWTPRFGKNLATHLKIPALKMEARVSINGKSVPARIDHPAGWPPELVVTIEPSSAPSKIEIEWSGAHLGKDPVKSKSITQSPVAAHSLSALPANAQFTPVDLNSAFNDRVTQIFKNEYRSPRSPFVSLAQPKQGLGGWAGSFAATADVDDSGLRMSAAKNNGQLRLPNGLSFTTPTHAAAPNVVFTSQWDNYPREKIIPLKGRAHAVYLLMAGSTNWMQSRIDNGEVVVTYTDGTTARLALRNPETWWPIDQDYFVDDYQFRHDAPLPLRIALKSGEVYTPKGLGEKIPGGAATVLSLELDPAKQLESLTVRTLANEVVIGLMAATLVNAEPN